MDPTDVGRRGVQTPNCHHRDFAWSPDPGRCPPWGRCNHLMAPEAAAEVEAWPTGHTQPKGLSVGLLVSPHHRPPTFLQPGFRTSPGTRGIIDSWTIIME